MFGQYKKCYCMNNDCGNNDNLNDNLEMSCQNNMSCNTMYNENCNCGFDDEYKNVFPDDPMLGQSYVPYQYMDKTFKPQIGLKMGTIFPELVSPYFPCQSMETIKYLESTNQVKEGCNG